MPASDITDWRSPRARIGALSRSRATDDPDLAAARLDLRAARLAEHIKRTVDTAPPLTNEQREKLALLLHDSAPNRGSAA